MAKVSSAREDMLAVATDLFRARGYEGVGIAELLEKSGSPRGSLYFHFDGFIDQVFKATAKESKEREYCASCPMAAIATGFGSNDVILADAVRGAFNSWEAEIRIAVEARGMTKPHAAIFASAMLTAMEGAFVISKAQRSDAPHKNACRAIKALAATMLPH
jgi:TetR/AcrR family transcriptional regulator, lmrAB and yxaGH operons repressor